MKFIHWKMPVKQACAIIAVALLQSSQSANVEVKIENFAFAPSSVTIKAGDSVTWRQIDSIQHTSTSGNPPVGDGRWNSGLLSAGQSFSRTFTEAGTFRYFCQPHPAMVGTVVVQAAQAEAPTVSITSPANNTVLHAPGPVSIAATASVTGSTVQSVEFFNGASSLGIDTNEPFGITTELAAGTHSITARAMAANGQSTTSSAIAITVGSGAPPIENPYPPIVKTDLAVELELVADGLVAPLGMAAPGDGSGRLFIYDQAGLVHVVSNGTKLAEPLLDVRSLLVALSEGYDERGLLGLALHPNFAQNGLLYSYTSEPNGPMADFMIMEAATNNHQSVVAEWKIDAANPNRVDPNSRREVLRIDKPQFNHNAGTMHFGPDGMLYIALGDGGDADDEGSGHSAEGNAQNLDRVLGKILRIDVNTRTAPNGKYGVPTDNPFVGKDGLDEIYAYGLRNPYTWSFDRLTGEMYVADVGQNQIEEVNRIFKGGNYGWRIKEGTFLFNPNGTNAGFVSTNAVVTVPKNLVDPIAEYDHSEGTAIVGGYVYRGTRIPGLIGKYVSGDFGQFALPAGRLFVLERNEFRELRIGANDRPLGLWLKGFGQDSAGEIYVMASSALGPSGNGGQVFKLVPHTNTLTVAKAAKEGTNLVLTLAGGVGPFAVQSKPSITDPFCGAAMATSQRSASLPMDGPARFVRVADLSGNGSLAFSASLSGVAERPTPVTTTATGSGNFSLNGNTLHFDIRYSGLSGTATAAHIHGRAKAATAANVLIDLSQFKGDGFGAAGVLAGSVILTAEQKAALLAGETYVNVHTDLNKGGEIRGQIAPLAYLASLNGAAERLSPIATAGRGTAVLLLVGNQLTFNIEYSNLSTNATLAHIHGPGGTEVVAGVMVNLAPFNGGSFEMQGTLRGSVTLTPDQLAALVDGLTYINIHTDNNKPGEIRGQIVPAATAAGLSARLSGASERLTPVETPGTGTGLFALEGSTLHFNVQYGGLKAAATAAHIHAPATASANANVKIDLKPFNGGAFGTNGILAGRVELTDEQRAGVVQGRTYVNVHTSSHLGGEIRGQIVPSVMHAEVLGASERTSSVVGPGRGRGTFILVGDQLSVQASYSGLSGTATAAHIHGSADTSAAADVIKDLAPLNGGAFGSSGSFSGILTLDAAQISALVDGLTYLNVHTSGNQGGEIRGQIIR